MLRKETSHIGLRSQLVAIFFVTLLSYVGIVKSIHFHQEYKEKITLANSLKGELPLLTAEGHLLHCPICDFTFEPAEEASLSIASSIERICSVLETATIPLVLSSYSTNQTSRAPPCLA